MTENNRIKFKKYPSSKELQEKLLQLMFFPYILLLCTRYYERFINLVEPNKNSF